MGRDEVFGVFPSNNLTVFSVSLADGGTPGSPCISRGAGSREGRKGREGNTTGGLGSRNDGCLGKRVVVGLPLVAVVRPGWGCSPRRIVSRNYREGLIEETGEILTESGLFRDEGKVGG